MESVIVKCEMKVTILPCLMREGRNFTLPTTTRSVKPHAMNLDREGFKTETPHAPHPTCDSSPDLTT